MWSLERSSGDIQADHQSSRETMTSSSQAGTQSHVSGEAPVTCHVSPDPAPAANIWPLVDVITRVNKENKQYSDYSEHIHMVHISQLGGGGEDPVSVRV